MTNTLLENSDMSLGDIMTDDFNWDFLTDLNNANTSELFSIPFNSTPAEVSQIGPTATIPTQVDDLSWLDDALRAPAAVQQPVAFPAAPAPESAVRLASDLLNTYPDLRNHFQSNGSPYFAVPQQNRVVMSSGFNHTHHADPTSTQAAPFSTSPSMTLRQMATPARRTSLGRERIRCRSSNSSTSDEYTAAFPPKAFTSEKPQHDPKHPWHRINIGTRGVTKRSGKINQYEAEKMYKQGLQNPFGAWRSPNYKFDYHKHGELTKLEYSTEAIKEFIYHHPVSADSKLRLWIQKTPADSGRRYPTNTLAKCRFSECPSRKATLNGTIWTGHIRVAVDERSQKYKDKADPYFMAGYFHLYCFEKFLDLPELCRLPNVEVLADTRQLANEPNMRWSASLSTTKEGIVAQRFIESCRKGRSQIRDFPHYPRPHNMLPGADKLHEHMLNYRMQRVKEDDRARASKDALTKRTQRESQVNVNFGDLEIACAAKIAMRKSQPPLKPRQKRRQRRSSWISEVDSDYVSEAEAPERMRKKRRVDGGSGEQQQTVMGPSSSAAQSPHQQANTTELFGSGYPVYAWQQYTSDPALPPAPVATQISTTFIPSLDTALFAPTPLPNYPPLMDPEPTTLTRSIPVPRSYTLTDFTLARPAKRSAPSDKDSGDESIASRVVKRQRRSSLSARSPNVQSPPSGKSSSRTSKLFVFSPPLRRSSRLSSIASVASVNNDRRRSPRLAESLSSANSVGSLGSLFEG